MITVEVPQKLVIWDFKDCEPRADLLDHVKEWCDESGVEYFGYVDTHRSRHPEKWFYLIMDADKAMLFKLRWL